MSNEDLREINVSIEQTKNAISQHDALKRLVNNPDWKLIIDNLYLKDNAVRLVMLRGDYNMKQDVVLAEIDAIARFNGFLSKIEIMGERASGLLEQELQTRDEIELEIE